MKEYQEPYLLQILRCLHPRMELSASDFQQYERLQKGHEGERQFAEMLAEIDKDWIVLHSLLLEHNQSLFQLDTVIITGETIYVIDVKNNDGEYYIEEGNWFTITGTDMKNPIHQLNRSVTLLRRFLQDSGITFPLTAYALFINQEFTLYQAPRNLPMILPTQVPAFLRKLQRTPSRTTEWHRKVAKKLIAGHIEDSPYSRPPAYSFEQLKKGIVCVACQSLRTVLEGQTVVCRRCGKREKVRLAVLRSVHEFQLLFPKERLTTNIMYDWCGGTVSKKVIRTTLKQHFKLIGHGPTAEYIAKE